MGIDALLSYARFQRRIMREKLDLATAVESENGRVVRLRRLGWVFGWPFDPRPRRPLYYRIDAEYADRKGAWFVATDGTGAAADSQWAWVDSAGPQELPAPRDGRSRPVNSICAVPLCVSYAVMVGLAMAVAAIALLYPAPQR